VNQRHEGEREREEGRQKRETINLSRANGLDLADFLDRDVSAGLGAELNGGAVAGNHRVGNLDVAGDIDLDQEQVDRELLDLGFDSLLDLDVQLASELLGDLGRSLVGDLDSILDNVLGLELDAGSVMGRATLSNDSGKVGAEVGGVLGLDGSISLSLDGALDGGMKSRGKLGAKTEIDVDKAAVFVVKELKFVCKRVS
jgi:hypothetical protein